MFRSFDPEEEEITVFTIGGSNDYSYDVDLLCYGKKATLFFSELSKKRIRKNPQSFLKKNKTYACRVLREEHGHLYVSYKQVNDEEQKKALECYHLSQKFYNLPQRLCHYDDSVALDLWQESFVDCLRDSQLASHPLVLISDSENFTELGLPEIMKNIIEANHRKLFGFEPHVCEKTITVMSFAIDGNEKVKESLRLTQPNACSKEELADDEQKTSLELIISALPNVTIRVSGANSGKCTERLEEAIKAISSVSEVIVI